MFSRPGLGGTMSTYPLQETVGISVLNFNLFLAVSSSAHTWCYNYIWAIGSAIFHLGRTEDVSPLQARFVIQTDMKAGMSCDHMIRPAEQDTHLGAI